MWIVRIRRESALLETDVYSGSERTIVRLRWLEVARRATYQAAKEYAQREYGDCDHKITWESNT